MLLIRFIQPLEELKRSGMRQKAYGHVLSYQRDVRSVHAGYLKIVKADRDRFALAEGAAEGERRKNRAVEEDGSFARVEGCI